MSISMNKKLTPQRTLSIKTGLAALLVVFATGCAQVPPSSVTLSNSIAEDVTAMQKAHKDFVNYYFDDVERKATHLLNNYRQALIEEVLKQDAATYQNPKTRENSLFNAVQEAYILSDKISPEERKQRQENALSGVHILYSSIDKSVERKRLQLFAELKHDREQFLTDLDAHYQNVLRKNEAITSLLSSVVKVHGSQQEVAAMVGIEKNLREELGNKLAKLSDKAREIHAEVNEKSEKLEDIEKAFSKLKEIIKR